MPEYEVPEPPTVGVPYKKPEAEYPTFRDKV